MMIHDITARVGKHKSRKRIGRGEGSGTGGTAGRGHKGAKSRSGYTHRPAFEGGQMPLTRRMPKIGFSNARFRNEFHVVNLRTLEAKLDDGATVDARTLFEADIIRNPDLPVKVLGDGDLTKKLTVTAAKFSRAAKEKIEKAGGTVNVVERRKWARPASSGPKKSKKNESKEEAAADEA